MQLVNFLLKPKDLSMDMAIEPYKFRHDLVVSFAVLFPSCHAFKIL
jgi:hypothetical protein